MKTEFGLTLKTTVIKQLFNEIEMELVMISQFVTEMLSLDQKDVCDLGLTFYTHVKEMYFEGKKAVAAWRSRRIKR